MPYRLDDHAERLDTAIAAMASRGLSERGKVYFLCDDAELVEECGHYLIHGSEYLMCLAVKLSEQRFSPEDFTRRLRNIGVPTVFEVDVPLACIPKAQIDLLCRSTLAEWGTHNVRSTSGGADGVCLILRQDLPAHCIRHHFHPTRIPDPHRQRIPYLVTKIDCDAPSCVKG